MLMLAVGGSQFMTEPSRFIARKISAASHPAYLFRFLLRAVFMRKEWPGAPHPSEIPFVFDTVKEKYGKALTAADEKAAQEINAYWVNFAKTGDPNGPGLPTWPLYKASSDQLLNFTTEGPKGDAG